MNQSAMKNTFSYVFTKKKKNISGYVWASGKGLEGPDGQPPLQKLKETAEAEASFRSCWTEDRKQIIYICNSL